MCIVSLSLLASEGYDGNVDDGLSLCIAEMAPKVPAMQCTNVALSVRSESSPARGLASCQSVADLCASIIHNEVVRIHPSKLHLLHSDIKICQAMTNPEPAASCMFQSMHLVDLSL